MSKTINAAIQMLPQAAPERVYEIIDTAIDVIKKSGLKHQVCPFETVVEGTYERIMDVVLEMQTACFESGCDELLVNLKLHISSIHDLHMEDKTQKYNQNL